MLDEVMSEALGFHLFEARVELIKTPIVKIKVKNSLTTPQKSFKTKRHST